MLQQERIDFVLDNGFNLRKELKRSQPFFKSKNFYPVDYRIEDLMWLKLYPAFAYTQKGSAFARIFDEEIAQLLASGKLRLLFDKWGFTPFLYTIASRKKRRISS